MKQSNVATLLYTELPVIEGATENIVNIYLKGKKNVEKVKDIDISEYRQVKMFNVYQSDINNRWYIYHKLSDEENYEYISNVVKIMHSITGQKKNHIYIRTGVI